jgi:hypothetical protein
MEKTGQKIINASYREIQGALENLVYATTKKDMTYDTHLGVDKAVDLIGDALAHLATVVTITEEE